MTEHKEDGIAGVKKITFDFDFTYPKNGDEDIGNTIVLREPSYEDLETHARMTCLVTKGMFGAMPVMKGMLDETGENPGAQEKSKDDNEQSAMFLMALGMDDKKYIEFIRFVKKLLTNDSRYARIDGEEIGISDLLWKELERKGGKKAVDKVLSSFVGFFIEAMSQAGAEAA